MDNVDIQYSEVDIRNFLKEVKDPEIPPISIVDLGIVTKISITESNDVHVTLTPTFAGCPALKIMEDLVKERLNKVDGIGSVSVNTSFETTWTTDMISEEGREALLKHGLAPPKQNVGYMELDVLSDTPCPYCSSRNTMLKSPFGPTLCRSLHYCNNCKQAFEGFKPV
ncbi:MAG: phenylacetate-CoA oxygenase subunit PaaJ [Bacteroidetes bacterium]|jgi:ring-1,2-phenylacetyl-CoA epoxidase subunit PaaD|nr:phenylacetate-CoA oxygenase subunit PaaJ [Bacteroidota bacterium]